MMKRGDDCYRQYVQILKEELRPAMGCTEPIAIAYAAAKARSVLGSVPERLLVEVSGNIIKNVKSVVVPHTGGLRGIPSAAAAGAVAGDADAELEVLSHVTDEEIAAIGAYLEKTPIEVRHADTGHIFDIMVTAYRGEDSAFVRITDYHTNVVSVKRNNRVLMEKEIALQEENGLTDRACLTIQGIVDFAECVDVEDVREILERQISYNMAIAEEGLRNDYGANIGKTVLRGREYDINYKMRAWAAAASDARMSGCELPVVINSGSGNQGMTVSLPVIVYAKELDVSHEKLIRSLVLANLIALHQKRFIGYLSAYCGAVSAAAGAGCGICWMKGGTYEQICDVITNCIATAGGMVCDGAKSSCAGKISIAVETALMSVDMALNGHVYRSGEGMVKKDIEETIEAYGRMAAKGMKETDVEILNIMLEG